MNSERSTRIETEILAALARVIDPEIRRPITELGMIGDVSVDDSGAAQVALKLTIVGCPAADTIERDVTSAVLGSDGVTSATVDVRVMTGEERAAMTAGLLADRARAMPFTPDSLTRVIAVTSGKGGVGKSTITANLAVAFAAKGLRVGLIDADVFGFSIPGILGIAGAKPTRVDELMLPPVAYSVKVISIGMFLPSTGPSTRSGGPSGTENTAVSWRGPMLHRTINQFLTDVYFGDLDILLLDLPPGTGDVAISVGQLLPHAEVLVVTTPQLAAAEVAERSGLAARQTGQRVIGVVENMAGIAQPDGTVLDLFGRGGGEAVATRLEVPLLASIPLSVSLREGGDGGAPVVLAAADDPAASRLLALADALVALGRGLAGKKLPVRAN